MTYDTKKKLSLIICCCFGALFVSFFSYSTSPLYPYFFGNDSAHFLTVGKGWSLGKIPYIDMFDHKGPLIYFIDMIGLIIGGGNKAGVSIIQIIFMCFTAWSIFEISQLVRKSNLYGIIAVVIVLICYTNNYIAGNTVEEYCQPFLCWSTYFLLRWYKDKGIHNCNFSFFYGITAGVCMMTRITNIVPICGGIFVICVYLIIKKHFKNLIQNAIFFLTGVTVIVLPFIIYFLIRDGLSVFFYDVFLFNIEYTKGLPSWIKTASIDNIKTFFSVDFYFCIIFPIIILRLYHKDYLQAFGYIIAAILESYILFNGYLWPQYPAVCLVQVVLLLNEIIILSEASCAQELVLSIIICLCLSAYIIFTIMKRTDTINIWQNYKTHAVREWENLLSEIPEEDLDRFVAWGGSDFKELYLLGNVMPCYKYYVIQPWISGFSDFIKNDVLFTFQTGDAKWILADNSTPIIDDVLSNRYDLYDTTDKYFLYKLK